MKETLTIEERLELLELELRELKTSVLVALKATQRLDGASRQDAAHIEELDEQLTRCLAELRILQEQIRNMERRKRWRKR